MWLNGLWGACTNATFPVAELCDGLDNDCDGVFDNGFVADGDGYTSCGTNHSSCDPISPNAGPTIAGMSASVIVCDDGDATRHPCQFNHCDSTTDFNCSGQQVMCNDSTSCASLGYFGGFDTVTTTGPGHPVCYFLGSVGAVGV